MAKKLGLGRGLDAILSRQEAVSTSRGGEIAVSRLRPNRRQPRSRFDDRGLEELADSIRSRGVIQPLVVTPADDDTYTIVAGERRWRAAKLAGLDRVPVVVRDVSGDGELLELALVENLQRADLDAIEEAEAYRALRDSFDLSQEEIASRVGKARSTVTNSLRLLGLPEEVRDLVRDGSLSAGQVRPLVALGDAARQVELARRIVDEGLSARAIEKLAAKRAEARKRPQRAKVDVHTAAAAEALTRSFQTKVEIRRRGRGGAVHIHFHGEQELMAIYERLLATERA